MKAMRSKLLRHISNIDCVKNLQNVWAITNFAQAQLLCPPCSPLFYSRSNSNSSSSKNETLCNIYAGHVNMPVLESRSSYHQSKIVSEDDHIIAINKPHGMSVYGSPSSNNTDEEPLSLVSSLHELSQRLDIEELEIGLSLKSYYSGLVLLTKTPSAAEKLRKTLSGIASQKNLYLTYLAIVVGKPQCEIHQKKEMFLERQYLHDREMSVVCDKSVHSSRKEGKMIQTAFSLKVISSNDTTSSSLVEIQISKDKWDAVPVLLSHYLSPVLGDSVYFSRTNYLMGVPIPVPPHIALPGLQRLPVRTENAIWDHFELETTPLPLFLHRSKVTLPNFPVRSSTSYEISAPPPAEFTTALNCLGLHLDHVR